MAGENSNTSLVPSIVEQRNINTGPIGIGAATNGIATPSIATATKASVSPSAHTPHALHSADDMPPQFLGLRADLHESVLEQIDEAQQHAGVCHASGVANSIIRMTIIGSLRRQHVQLRRDSGDPFLCMIAKIMIEVIDDIAEGLQAEVQEFTGMHTEGGLVEHARQEEGDWTSSVEFAEDTYSGREGDPGSIAGGGNNEQPEDDEHSFPLVDTLEDEEDFNQFAMLMV